MVSQVSVTGSTLYGSKQWDLHPYTDGHEDKVIEIKWGEASIHCPPGDWFHQHFNTGKELARHLAVRTAAGFIRSVSKCRSRGPTTMFFAAWKKGVG